VCSAVAPSHHCLFRVSTEGLIADTGLGLSGLCDCGGWVFMAWVLLYLVYF
jgi:hypothetical protein